MGYSTWTIDCGDVTVPAENLTALTAAIRQRAAELTAVDDPYQQIDIDRLDTDGVAAVFADAGLEVFENPDGGFAVNCYDGTYNTAADELLPLLAAHATPGRLQWVVTGEDGTTWIDRFENGTYSCLDAVVVPAGCLAAAETAYQALHRQGGPDLAAAAAALREILADLGRPDPDQLEDHSDG